MMYRQTIDLGRHRILESQAYELSPVNPPETFLHELTHPCYDATFACAGETMHKIQQRFLPRCTEFVGALQAPSLSNAERNVPRKFFAPHSDALRLPSWT